MLYTHTHVGTLTYYSMTRMMSWRDSKAAYSWMRLAWLSWFITWISFLTTSWETDRNTIHLTHLQDSRCRFLVSTFRQINWENVWKLINSKTVHQTPNCNQSASKALRACMEEEVWRISSWAFFVLNHQILHFMFLQFVSRTRILWTSANCCAVRPRPLSNIMLVLTVIHHLFKICLKEKPKRSESRTLTWSTEKM